MGKKLLSRAESDVYIYILKGMSNQQIADKLFVSEKTVKFHCGSIFKKKEVKTRHELIAKHFNNGKREKHVFNTQQENKRGGLEMGQGQNNLARIDTTKEALETVDEKFKVGEVMNHLHLMMKGVTKDQMTPETVMAACNCVARLNETIGTAIEAARFLKNG